MVRAFKLLFVINAPITGGAERHTLHLAEELSKLGCQSTIFAIKRGPLAPSSPVVLLQPNARRRLASRIGDLRKVIEESRPDVIVSVNERPVLVAFLGRIALRHRPPIVAITHSTVLNNRRERLMQLGYTPLFNRADKVVFVSRAQRVYWEQRGFSPRASATILNGVDLDYFSPEARVRLRPATRSRFRFQDDDLVLGLCAVMRPEKNHLQLVECIGRLRQRHVRVKALLVGDGPCRDAIEARIRALGLTEAVVVTGMTDDVRSFVAAFDLGVLCSVSIETLSLAALEVMAMGLPMIMSDLGGASEIVQGDNGRLFPVGDDVRLDEAVMELADPETRRAAGVAARRHVEAQFDRKRMIAAYHDTLVP